jgi:hypothetical protein
MIDQRIETGDQRPEREELGLKMGISLSSCDLRAICRVFATIARRYEGSQWF